MKNFTAKILIAFMVVTLGFKYTLAQAPEGIIYQAEARDSDGEILANKTLKVSVSVLQGSVNGASVWTGQHQVITNDYGMFVLVIGTGSNMLGTSFEDIDWSADAYFLNVKVMSPSNDQWIDMGTSQFLSVPYALHAKTASALAPDPDLTVKSAKPGVKSQTWSLFGNYGTDPTKDFFGTTDDADLVFITDNTERLRITSEGQLITADGVGLELGGNLQVHGDSTYIDKDLYVGRNVYLNVNEAFDPMGETFNYGNFTVANQSSTYLTGSLTVDEITTLNNTLYVSGAATFDNTLLVNGNAHFDADLNVDGYFSINNNMFTVDPTTGNTFIGGDLKVAGDAEFTNITAKDTAFSRSLLVKDNLSDGGFLATFENTNNGKGDGIKIKLGKKAAKNNPLAEASDEALRTFVGKVSTDDFETIKNLLDGDLDAEDLAYLALLQVPTPEDAFALAATICTFTETIGNELITFLNDNLGLPAKIGPYGIDTDILTVNVVPEITVIPSIPSLDLPCEALGEGFTLPTLELEDVYVVNPLDKDNSFIRFTDNTDWKMGEIKAQTIEGWALTYLDPVFLYQLYTTFKGMDKMKLLPEMYAKGKEIATDYLKIGVQYSSGNGDYAEWLERIDPKEQISAGDIVGVISGKITKDLTNAEQVMAISHRPIVLGNTPEEGKIHLGNNVAFMGQIPVKVMGEVRTGDYIIGDSEIAGYGKAVHPEDMTAEQLKFAVGRSWDNNLNSGPKMVNTVVGVHNGDYLHILQKYDQKFSESENRLQALEKRIDALSVLLLEAENK